MLLCCHKSSRHDDGRGAFLKNRDRVKLEDFCKQHCIDYWIDDGQLIFWKLPNLTIVNNIMISQCIYAARLDGAWVCMTR